MSQPLEVCVNCPDEGTASALARAALDARLAAAASVGGPTASYFHWQGRIEERQEWRLALKSQADCLDDLTALLRQRHPYRLPSITWTAIGAETDAAAWIREETGG